MAGFPVLLPSKYKSRNSTGNPFSSFSPKGSASTRARRGGPRLSVPPPRTSSSAAATPILKRRHEVDRPTDRPADQRGGSEGEVIRGRRQFHGNWVLSNCYPRPLPLCPTQMFAPWTTTLCHVRAEIKKDSRDGILWTWRWKIGCYQISRGCCIRRPLPPSPPTRERRKIYACYLVRLSPPRA